MGIGTTFSIKAPKLVSYFKGIDIDIDSENGVFTERSCITLPSGQTAFFYDGDGSARYMGKQALYVDNEGWPRWLHGMKKGGSLAEWFINHLVDVGEEERIERFIDKQYLCIDFCQEAKEIISRYFHKKKDLGRIKELDDLIEEASFLYLSNWGGNDFDYAYVEVKDGKASYRVGYGLKDDPYERWYWDNYNSFIELVKGKKTAVKYKRQSGKWVKDMD